MGVGGGRMARSVWVLGRHGHSRSYMVVSRKKTQTPPTVTWRNPQYGRKGPTTSDTMCFFAFGLVGLFICLFVYTFGSFRFRLLVGLVFV